jgi:uncharacterized protein YjiS (DUF1127 family)
MAYINTTRAAHVVLADRFAAAFKSVKDAMQRRSVFVQTRHELNNLSTRELDDLGINRSMITRIALEAAYGK